MKALQVTPAEFFCEGFESYHAGRYNGTMPSVDDQ